MIEILNWLVENTSFKMKNIRLEESIIRGYCDEWLLTINGDEEIWCQEAKYKTGYLIDGSSVTFVHSDVNSKFITKNNNSNFIEFDICGDKKTLEIDSDDDTDKSSTKWIVNGRKVTNNKEIIELINKHNEINKKFDEIMNLIWLF